ncbi:receptor-type tyrosine-protein phosphatase V-like [Chelonoidis abingdonii]|uniref:receptor-type tyrosine-protein phosphatase V-like n=1 Tax=Chelonoidis abingdonii TaxID=106734 RepID=UPI003F497E48
MVTRQWRTPPSCWFLFCCILRLWGEEQGGPRRDSTGASSDLIAREGEGCNRTTSEGHAGAEVVPGERGSFLNVSISDQGRPDSLFLSWDEPDGGALGYTLAIYTLEPDVLLQNGSAGPNATSFQFQGLVPGTGYSIEVTAALACAEASSQRVSGQTSPAPVHNLSLSSDGSPSALRASWMDAPGQKDGYRLVLYHLNSQGAVRNESVPRAVSTFLFDGLLAGSEYALRIITLAGARQASTSTHQWTAPTTPAALTLQSLGSSTSLFASWSHAEGAAWLHLTLHNLLSHMMTRTVSAKRGLSIYTFQHLSPGTLYHLGVSAAAGPYWAAGPNATAWTYPLSPVNLTLSITGEAGSLQAHWTPPAGERDYYLVTLHQGESRALSRNVSVGGDSAHISFHGLSPGNQYSVRVTAVAGPHRAPSLSATAWTQPLAPPGVSLSSQGSTSTLHAHWKEVAGAGYVVTLYSLEPAALVKNSSEVGGVTNLTYEGLSPGTHYAFVISTVAGPYASPPLRITNWTYPSPVEELSLSNQGQSTSLHASWKGAAASRVNYSGVLLEARSQAWLRNVTVGENCSNITFQGLSPGRQYTLEMAAVAGPYRSPVRTATDWTYPLAPSGVTLTSKRHPLGLSAAWHRASGDRDQFLIHLYSKELLMQQNVSVGPDTQNFTFLGLLPGIQYSVEVTALAGPYRALAPSATAWTYPVSLANVSVTRGPSPRELHVGWMELGGAGDHWVQLYADESQSIIRNTSIQHGATHVDLDGLVPGTRYLVEIVSQAGPHRTSSQTAIGYTAPLMPLSPAMINGGSTSALLVHWEAPAGQRDGYLVSVYEEGSLAAGRRVNVGKDSTNVSLAGLAPGSCYHVGISALAGPYSSDPQNVTGCTVPAAPANVSLTNSGSSSVLRAAWDEPPGGRDHYRVILYSLAPWGIETAQSLGPNAQNITWTHLAAGSRFTAQVTAVKGPYESSSVNVTQWTYPLAPANLTLASPSASALQVSWTGTEGRGEGYTVVLYNVSSGRHVGHTLLPWSARNHTFQSLTPGTRYSVGVSTTAGPYHSSTPNLTHWTHPVAPLTVSVANQGHPDRLSASWGAAAGGREGYVLTLYHAGSGAVAARAIAGEDTHNFTFTELAPGYRHSLEVVSIAGPYRAAADNVSDWTYPLPPPNISLMNQGHSDRLTASWGAAAGGRDGYTLTLYHAGSGAVAARVSVGNDTHNFTFMNLAPGSQYLLELASTAGPYGMSTGNISNWTYPLAPPNVYLRNQGHSDRLSASWGAGAGERDGYTLTLYHAQAGTVAANASVRKDAHKFTFSGLAPGHKYLLEVASVAGPYRTFAGNISDWTTPLVPVNFSAMPGESRTVLAVSWGQAPSQQDYCQLWLRGPGNTLPQRQTLAGGQVQHFFRGLVPGRNYSVSLSCVAGPYWSSTGILVVPIAPDPVEDLQCQPDSKGFSLSWTFPAGDVETCELAAERLSGGSPQAEAWVIAPRSKTSLWGLEPDSSYRISVSAVGRNGLRSRAVTLVCNTSAEVLPPPVRADVPRVEPGSRVLISPDTFSEENGQIEYYAVIVTSNESLSRPTQETVSSTWYDHYYGQEDSYVAVLLPNPFHPDKRSTPQIWSVPVGTDECGQSREICNGKLKANTQYRFSIAAFTKYDLVDPSVSFTAFSAAGAGADPSPVTVPVVAGIVAGFLLTLGVIFGWVYWKRVRSKRTKKSNLSQEMTTYSLRNVHRPIPIQSFKQYYEAKTANANHGFFQDFEELKEVGKEQPKVEAELPANVSKNRYPHVLPYDHSRVRLSLLGEEPHSDYINANYIPGYASPQEFIVTQGPLKKTIEDFWRLVWEQSVCNIIMLTVGMENGRVLCDHYWPSELSLVSYGHIHVDLLSQSSADEWTMRTFKLWHEDLREERHVTHLHYTAWPDHGIPESTASLMAFLDLARGHMQKAKGSGPTLVHCSAGVGRSGTFIALDRLLQQLKQEKVVDVFNTIYTMRMSRYSMIQTLGQYVFLHSCILEKITEELLLGQSGTEISCPIPLKSFLQHHAQKSAKSNAGFLREYEILLEVAKDKASSAAPSTGIQESRPGSSILPYDRSRVKFSPLEQGPFSDLSQTWLLPGCNSTRDYLAVQGPDKVTMEEFWRLVWDHGVHTIVTLLPCQEKSQVLSDACWPLEGSPVYTELLTIQRGLEKHVSGWRCIQLKLKHEKKVKERQVQRFLYPLWGCQQQPDVQLLVEFLTAVRRCMPHRKRAGPLLLHCSSGIGQMGMLIALDCLLHQMKAERSVDVYGVTLRLMRSCCLMTPTLDQYVFLYTCIRDILTQKQP